MRLPTTIPARSRGSFAQACALGLLAAGCFAPPEAAPLPLEQLEFDLSRATAQTQAEVAADGTLALDEAAAAAVVRHPALVAARAELEVGDALLVEAGVWPDPTFQWSAVDWLVHGTSDDVLTGFALSWPLLRPGERDARIAGAGARAEALRAEVAAAEWLLGRDVRMAWIERAELEQRNQAAARALAAARELAQFVEQARALRASTGLTAALAQLEAVEAEAELADLALELEDARSALNRRLGLPVDAALALAPADDERFAAPLPEDSAALASAALRRRPEMRRALCEYAAAEQDVQLEGALRNVGVGLGSAISLMIPIGSDWNRPALASAFARRARQAARMSALAYDIQAQVAAAVRALRAARARADLTEQRVTPMLEEFGAQLRAARESRSAPAGELLLLQRRALEVSALAIGARWEVARRALELEWTLGPELAPGTEQEPQR